MKYLSLDIETTGINPEHHHVLQFAAVLDDLSVQAPVEELPRYIAYVLPPDDTGYHGDPFALQMNQSILEDIAKRDEKGRWEEGEKPLFLHPAELARSFASWATEQGLSTYDYPKRPGVYAVPARSLKDIRFVPAGKNVAGFDLPFLRRCIPGWSEMRVAHRALDPGMLYLDPFTDKVPPNLSQCLERAGLNTTVTHQAVEDALQVVELLRHKYPLNRSCMCDGGGSIAHIYGPRCTSGGPH